MRFSHLFQSFVVTASLLGSSLASPCKPSSPPASSVSSISESTVSSTSFPETTSTSTTEPSSSSQASFSAASESASPSSTIDIESSSSSFPESSLFSTAVFTPSSSLDVSSFTTADVIPTSVISTSSETITSSDNAPASTSISSTSSNVATSTRSLPSAVATFTLQGANSARSDANDQTVQWRSGNGWALYLYSGDSSSSQYWSTGEFYLQADTNRLMVSDGLYVIATSENALYTVSTVYSNQAAISCTSPAYEGEALQCSAEGSSRSQFYVRADTAASAGLNIYIMAAGSGSPYASVDLVAI